MYYFFFTEHSAVDQLCPYREVIRETARERAIYGLSFREAYNKVLRENPNLNCFSHVNTNNNNISQSNRTPTLASINTSKSEFPKLGSVNSTAHAVPSFPSTSFVDIVRRSSGYKGCWEIVPPISDPSFKQQIGNNIPRDFRTISIQQINNKVQEPSPSTSATSVQRVTNIDNLIPTWRPITE